MYEVGNGALDVVGLSVGQSCLRMDSEDTLSALSHAGVSVWRRVLCSVARLSRLPDTACLKCFGNIGKKCVLDLNAGETYTPIWLPECGLETVTPKPPFPHCRVEVVPLLWSRKCAVVRGCAVVREMDIPRARHRMRGK